MKAYFDSNVFVLSVIDEGRRGDKARELFTDVIHGEVSAVSSPLTLDEVIWVLLEITKKKELALLEAQRFLQLSGIEWAPVKKEEISEAIAFMQKYNLGPRDAIHLAVALSSGCSSIVSDDADFDQIKEIKRIKLD